MKVKICGITNLEDALHCASGGADALGFIFYEKSKRFVDYRKAKTIAASLPFFVMKVGVFVNENPETVNAAASEIGLNAVQLHGQEDPDYLKRIELPAIKSFRVGESFDYSVIEKYNDCGILLDTFSPDGYGGTGKSFNWNSIPENLKNKIILSGGISADNIDAVVNQVRPAAIDLSSSLESVPGRKDYKKVKTFFEKLNSLRNREQLNLHRNTETSPQKS